MIASSLVFALGIAEAFTVLPSGGRARRVVAALSVLGILLSVGGYSTVFAGDHFFKIGLIMMGAGFVSAVIMLPIYFLTAEFGRKKKTGANNIAAQPTLTLASSVFCKEFQRIISIIAIAISLILLEFMLLYHIYGAWFWGSWDQDGIGSLGVLRVFISGFLIYWPIYLVLFVVLITARTFLYIGGKRMHLTIINKITEPNTTADGGE